MANNYTQLAENFRWPHEAAKYACALATLVYHTAEMMDGDGGIEWPDRSEGVAVDDKMRANAVLIAQEMRDIDDLFDLGCTFEADPAIGLCITGSESPQIYPIAQILQATMRRFNLKPVMFEWASVCSVLRAGEFGGGAAAISQADIRTMNSTRWGQDAIAAMEREAALDAGFESA